MAKKRGKDCNEDQTPPAGEELLTVQQVAENWQVSERMIRRMIANGRLPAVRIGRAVRIFAKTASR